MWPFKKKAPPRRAEPRKNSQPAGEGRWRQFRAVGGVGSVLLAAGLFAVVLAMDAWELEPLGCRDGGYLPRDAYARVKFEVFSAERTQEQRELAAAAAPAVITLTEQNLERIAADLKGLPHALKAATQPKDLPEPLRKKFGIDAPADLAALAALADPARSGQYERRVDDLRQRLLGRYIVGGADFYRCHEKETAGLRVRIGQADKVVPKSLLLNLLIARDLDPFLQAAVEPFEPGVRKVVQRYLQGVFAAGTPLFRLDGDATELAEDEARKQVGPVMETIPKGRLLALRTAKGGLKRSEWELLAAEHRAFVADQDAQHPLRAAWLLLARAGMIAGVVVLLCLYVAKYRPRIVKNHWRGFAIAALLSLMLLLSRILVASGGLHEYVSVFGIFMASVILAIAYDQRFAFAVGGALAVLTALQLRMGMGPLLVLWAAVAAAVFQLREVRTRSKLIETGVITAAILMAAAWAVGLAEGMPAGFLLRAGGWAGVAACVGGFIAQGVLPLIERAFNIATSLTLLEWCDANKPLLKRLALEAPGTYSHSLMLGSMCEAAADAIGARGLLGRVGAYYHDVGKINKPPYFVENQPGPGSAHDRLSPAMSLLVIKGHVKDGLELAKQYGLPPPLREFITSHHGSTLVEYFYHAAAQQRKEDAERAPDEVEFRYPGPKPRSAEAAILMLADASESAVRAMPEPTPGRVETQVHQVISKRLTDGQLDDCELRLREVHAIETSFTKSLLGMYHGRVQYPSQKKEDQPAEDKPAPADGQKPTGAARR